MTDPAILTMDQATDRQRSGGKAAALAALAGHGFDVPPFFVVTADAFVDATLTPAAGKAVDRALPAIGPGPFAVRSSAVDEDGAEHSHAGQLQTRLHVAADGISEAITAVRRSGDAAGLAAYRAARGIAGEQAPSVIVQRQLAPRAAGVAFSADPMTGRRDRIVVSAITGLADGLVGGEDQGHTVTIDAATGDPVGGSVDGVLSRDDLGALHRLAKAVEAQCGAPQDIEWAIDGVGLWLLQARPITTTLRPAPIADPAVAVFDNANIVESYPGRVSPLTFSFARYLYAGVYRSFLRLLGVRPLVIQAHRPVLANMLTRIDGRVYYNLLNWHRALALLPGYALSRGFMDTMMGVGEPLSEALLPKPPPRPRGWERLATYARIARVGLGLVWHAVVLRRTIRRFMVRLERVLAGDPATIAAMPPSALVADYRRIESELLGTWDAPLVNDLLCMIAFGLTRRLAERWAGADGIALMNDALIGQGDIISAEPAQRIRALGELAAGDPSLLDTLEMGDTARIAANPEFAAGIDAYLSKFGDRCAEELKLESVPLWQNPAPLHAAIRAAALAPTSPPARPRDLRDALRTLFGGRPIKRVVVQRLLTWTKARVRDRENLRFERTRVFGRARRVFLALGTQLHARALLDEPRDVFLLTLDEVLGAVEGSAVSHDLTSIVAMRRKMVDGEAAAPDPADRLLIHGMIGERCRQAASAPPDRDVQARSGIGCSAGIVQGRARVVRDPRGAALAPGEILVARTTDPGWIALFANAAGIVVERGSPLSHSAIVARELGIPCVVGLAGATDWLADGDAIEIDGGTGGVSRVAAADA